MKKTIAELRREEVIKLAHFKTMQPTKEDIEEAKSIMNAFYRLCGAYDRLVELDNNSRTCNLASTKQLSVQTEQRCQRLQQRLIPYGLVISFCGHLPSIGVCDRNGAFYEKISRYFYE